MKIINLNVEEGIWRYEVTASSRLLQQAIDRVEAKPSTQYGQFVAVTIYGTAGVVFCFELSGGTNMVSKDIMQRLERLFSSVKSDPKNLL